MDGSGTMRHEQCVNVELSGEQRRELLRGLIRRFGSIRKLAMELGVSKSSLHRLLKGEQVSGTIAMTVDYRICRLLGEDELYPVINRDQLLRSLGLLGEESVNVPLLLAQLDAVLDREEARNAVLELVAKRYKTELRQMLGDLESRRVRIVISERRITIEVLGQSVTPLVVASLLLARALLLSLSAVLLRLSLLRLESP